MAVQGIHHVSINVDDVAAAVAFYREALHLTVLERPELGFPGAWLGAGDQQVHLLGIQSGKPPPQQHFAFLVDDLDGIRERLTALGIKVSSPNEIANVCRQAFAHDPSGNMVEFNQRL